MNQIELQNKVRFWYLKFERISRDNDIIHTQIETLLNQADKLKAEIDIMKRREEKNSIEIFRVIQELEQLKQQSEEMTFENITLQKQ